MIGLSQHDASPAGARSAGRDGVQAWAAPLDQLGVRHSGVIDTPAGCLLVVEDPDGIPIEFFAST